MSSSRSFEFSQAANKGITVLPDLTTTPAVGDVASAGTVAAGKVTLKFNPPAGVGVFLPYSGGTMTGPLNLFRDPLNALEAAPKQYVDTAVSNALSTVSGGYLPLVGGTLTGQ